jgi:hypothetical protein
MEQGNRMFNEALQEAINDLPGKARAILPST